MTNTMLLYRYKTLNIIEHKKIIQTIDPIV